MSSATFEQQLVGNISTAILAFDANLNLQFVNPAAEVLLGLSATKLLGLSLPGLFEENEGLVSQLKGTVQTAQQCALREVELRLLPNNKTIVVDCVATAMQQDELEDQLILELTEVNRLLRMVRDGELMDRQAANLAIVRGLAHEIKNPLGGLRGAAQLLEQELPDPSYHEYTRIIIREADRLHNLVDRMTGPRRPFEKSSVNVHEILEHVRKLIIAEADNAVVIERDYDPSLPTISGETEPLIQAVLNIIRNSKQALEHSGVIRLRTRIEHQFTIGQNVHRRAIRIDIEDNGPGIPEVLQERMFYPMVTGRDEGTGLGLSIAQDIVSKHNGVIECNSKPGKTCFSIYIPVESNNGN